MSGNFRETLEAHIRTRMGFSHPQRYRPNLHMADVDRLSLMPFPS
jgi:hypothetical protein